MTAQATYLETTSGRRRAISRATVVLSLAIVLVLVFSAYSYYDQNTGLSAQSSQISTLQGEVASLQGQVTSLSSQASSLQSQLSQAQQSQESTSAQVTTLQGSLQTVQSQLTTINGELSAQGSTLSNQGSTLLTIEQQLTSVNATLQTLSSKLNSLFPQVPMSTLVVTGSSYTNSSATYTFQVENTQTFSVFAQLSVSFYGNACSFYAGEGSYLSQVTTFGPRSNTTFNLDFNSVTFYSSSFCGKEPIAYFSMDFVASSTQVSPSYTFYVVPGYQF